MNQEIYRPIELTEGTENTYSGSMPEASGSPDVNPQAQLIHEQHLEQITDTTHQQRSGLVDRWGRPLSSQPHEGERPAPLAPSGGSGGGNPPPENNGSQENAREDGTPPPEDPVHQGGPRPEDNNGGANRRGAETETVRDNVLSWLLDPIKRDEYFNEIYALVDSRPYDFWNTAFDQLNDGAIEHHFNDTLLHASKGDWEAISLGPRSGSMAGITVDMVRSRLEESGRSVDDLIREIGEDFQRYQRERQVRRTLHDVNAVLYLPTVKAEDLFNNMQQFDSASGDIALAMPGVREMMSIYENVLREIMAENEGFLPTNAVLGREVSVIKNGKKITTFQGSIAEKRTKERFIKAAEAGLIMTRAKQAGAGGAWEAPIDGASLKAWDIDRIYTISRGMMIMNERLISLAVESKLPDNSAKYTSAFLQDVVQAVSPYAHLLRKFDITEEALAAYLFKEEHDTSFFHGWDPHELERAYRQYQKDPDKLFTSLEDTFYLGRRNPNRAGDVYTWISWRGSQDPNVISMLQDYLVSGQEKMTKRWRDAGNPPDADIPDEWLNEYAKWTGTGFRFEKLRGDLSKSESHDPTEHEEFKHALKDAEDLMERMVTLQPHRLFTVSRWIRERTGYGNLTLEAKVNMEIDLENLSLVETAFLNARERLLDEGKRFDTIDLSVMDQFYEMAITDRKNEQGEIVLTKARQIRRAKVLAAKVRRDFARNKKEYWTEFVYKRENTHGYVLWSGDSPADELSFSALGATGGFVRRARDNMHQAKAAGAEVGLLDNLKNIQTPDQLMGALYGIWSEIDQYDRGKARQAITDKAEGLIKFYKQGWFSSKMPGGFLRKTSYARLAYGPHAAAWGSQEIHYLVSKLEHAHMIDKEQAHQLEKLTGGTLKHAAGEGAVSLAQMLFFALLAVAAETGLKEGFKSDELG